MEVLYEAFPQFVFGAYTMQALQLWEVLNISSFLISLISLLYGIADYVTSGTHGLDADFIMIVWSSLAACIDTVFRGLFLAYITSIVKAYVFVILFAYWLMIIITICISKRELFLENADYFDTWTSLVNSAYEFSTLPYNFRSRSKGTFSFLFLVSLMPPTRIIFSSQYRD